MAYGMDGGSVETAWVLSPECMLSSRPIAGLSSGAGWNSNHRWGTHSESDFLKANG